jgi:hypothetical protein
VKAASRNDSNDTPPNVKRTVTIVKRTVKAPVRAAYERYRARAAFWNRLESILFYESGVIPVSLAITEPFRSIEEVQGVLPGLADTMGRTAI